MVQEGSLSNSVSAWGPASTMSSSFTIDDELTCFFGGVVGGELKILMLAVVVSFAVTSDGNNDNDDNDNHDDNDKDVVDGNFNFVCSL